MHLLSTSVNPNQLACRRPFSPLLLFPFLSRRHGTIIIITVATIVIPALDSFCSGRGLRATVSVVSEESGARQSHPFLWERGPVLICKFLN